MWRAVFLAGGITLVLLGLQLFFVEQVEVKRLRGGGADAVAQQTTGQQSLFQTVGLQPEPRFTPTSPTFLYKPPEWMPWSLVAVGAVVLIYTFTIPRRHQSQE